MRVRAVRISVVLLALFGNRLDAREAVDHRRYAAFAPEAWMLHQPINSQKRYEVLRHVPLELLVSAPGHERLRSRQNLISISTKLQIAREAGSPLDPIFDSQAIVLNVHTAVEGETPLIKSIEVIDGHHRAAAALHAGMQRIGDVPKKSLIILVNGIDTHGNHWTHWIPLHIAKQSGVPFTKVPEWKGPKGPSGEISGDVSSTDDRIPVVFQGVALPLVVKSTLNEQGPN